MHLRQCWLVIVGYHDNCMLYPVWQGIFLIIGIDSSCVHVAVISPFIFHIKMVVLSLCMWFLLSFFKIDRFDDFSVNLVIDGKSIDLGVWDTTRRCTHVH